MSRLCRVVVLSFAISLFVLCINQVAEAKLLAGASKRSIVPPFPTNMGGFADRRKLFEGVHDEPMARALVLENDKTHLVVIGADLRSVEAALVAKAREQITAATGIPGSQILICASHSHSAPSYYQIAGEVAEPPLQKFLATQFAEVAIEAFKNRVPARAGFGAGNIVGLTRNRQQKNDDVIDPQVGVVRVEELDGHKTIATLYNFTGHPVIIGSNNLLLSGEYPGAASRAIEGLLGGVAIFTQGAAGDITVVRKGEPFYEIERFGRILAGEVIKTSGLINCTDTLSLESATCKVELPIRRVLNLAEAEAEQSRDKAAIEEAKKKNAGPAALENLQDKLRVSSLYVRYAKYMADNPEKNTGYFALGPASDSAPDLGTCKTKDGSIVAEVQVLKIGDVILVAIPGEIFVEYALELRARVKQETKKSMCLVGYANGYLGYIVTPRGIETGGYEASVTHLDATGGRRMAEAAMEMIRAFSD